MQRTAMWIHNSSIVIAVAHDNLPPLLHSRLLALLARRRRVLCCCWLGCAATARVFILLLVHNEVLTGG